MANLIEIKTCFFTEGAVSPKSLPGFRLDPFTEENSAKSC